MDVRPRLQNRPEISFHHEPCWKPVTACYQGGFPLFSHVLVLVYPSTPKGVFLSTSVAVAGQRLPRFCWCTKLLRHSAGFEILDVRLPVRGRTCRTSPSKTHLVVGAPRKLSYSKSFDTGPRTFYVMLCYVMLCYVMLCYVIYLFIHLFIHLSFFLNFLLFLIIF
jgi:hypothetical protein